MCSRKWLMVALVACGLASACSDYNTNLSIQTSSSVLTFVSPGTATVGGQGFTITANGAGFATGALILWNGTALTTTLVSSIQLTAPVPASDLATAGTVQVAVQIPGSAQSGTQTSTTPRRPKFQTLSSSRSVRRQGRLRRSLRCRRPPLRRLPHRYCGAQGFTLTVNGTKLHERRDGELERNRAIEENKCDNVYECDDSSSARRSLPSSSRLLTLHSLARFRCPYRIRLGYRPLCPSLFPLRRRRLPLPQLVR